MHTCSVIIYAATLKGDWHSFRKCLLNQPGKVANYAYVFVLVLLSSQYANTHSYEYIFLI